MSFTDPVTIADPTTGAKAAATLLNTWRTDMEAEWNAKAGCRLRTAVNTPLAAMIPFELEDYDNQGCHSTTVNTTRVTVPVDWGGMWWFGFDIRCSTAGAGGRLTVCLNGDTTAANALCGADQTSSIAGITSSAMGLGFARLVAGDYLELRGSSGTVQAGTFRPVFWAQWRAT